MARGITLVAWVVSLAEGVRWLGVSTGLTTRVAVSWLGIPRARGSSMDNSTRSTMAMGG